MVLGQSSDSKLGYRTHPKCHKLGGLPQPQKVRSLAYNPQNGQLTADAPNAAMVGYVLGHPSADRSRDVAIGYGTTRKPGFLVNFKATELEARLSAPEGDAWIGAAACLADNNPVPGSLEIHKVTYTKNKVKNDVRVDVSDQLRARLAQLACNAGK